MSCWHYHHCGSVTGPSSWCQCLWLACSSSLTSATPHSDKVAVGEKLNWAASRPVPEPVPKNWAEPAVSFWQPVPHSSKASFLSATRKHKELGCHTTAGSDDLAFLPVFGLHRHNCTWLGSAICDTRSPKRQSRVPTLAKNVSVSLSECTNTFWPVQDTSEWV